MRNETRLLIERRIVEKLLSTAQEDGWTIDSVYDGEEYIKTPTAAEALEAIFAVDDATVRFRKGDGPLRGVYIVLGNCEDVLSDYSDVPDLTATMDKVYAWIENAGYIA